MGVFVCKSTKLNLTFYINNQSVKSTVLFGLIHLEQILSTNYIQLYYIIWLTHSLSHSVNAHSVCSPIHLFVVVVVVVICLCA